MSNKHILTIAENRAAVHNISQRVLEGIAPDEAALSAGFLDATIATVASGYTPEPDSSDLPGGLGGVDWAALIVVPAVVAVLTNLLTRSGAQNVTALKSTLHLNKPDDIVTYIDMDDVTVIVKQAGGKWNKRKNRRFIQLVSAALWQCLEDDTCLSTTTSGGIPGEVCQRLYDTLLRCGPVKSDDALRARFRDARISPWYDKLPQAASQEDRVWGVIDLLYEQYTAARENALVMLLEVLCDQTDSGDACRQELAAVAGILKDVVGNNERNATA